MSTTRYQDGREIRRMIRAFEDCSLSRKNWDHSVHLTVTIWYSLQFDDYRAADRIITGIRAYHQTHCIGRRRGQGYHETVTIFWLAVAQAFLNEQRSSSTTTELVNEFLHRYGSRADFIQTYFSNRCLRSWEARHAWVEPDRRSLDFLVDDGDH